MRITNVQNRRLHKLLSDTNLVAWKIDYVVKYSNGRTSHSSELNTMEAQSMINALERVKKGTELPINHVDHDLKYQVPVVNIIPLPTAYFKGDKLRKAVISRFITMGAITAEGKSDIPFINEVLKHKWNKELNEFTPDELRRLIAVIDKNLLPWYYKQKKADPNFTINLKDEKN